MIKREFVENNLIKVLNYLPIYISNKNGNDFYLEITKAHNNKWMIKYVYDNGVNLFIVKQFDNLIDNLIYTIEQLDKYIPNFANNLIGI